MYSGHRQKRVRFLQLGSDVTTQLAAAKYSTGVQNLKQLLPCNKIANLLKTNIMLLTDQMRDVAWGAPKINLAYPVCAFISYRGL